MTMLVALVFIISCSNFLPMEANNIGFSVDLIHRDSPDSPLYNPNLSHYEHMEMAVQRSVKRSTSFLVTTLIPDGGEYLMKMTHGTPEIESLSLVDTGSILPWIQCLPCVHCFPSSSPPFNPKFSRTFKHVSCRLSRCLQLNKAKNNSCKPINAPCTYHEEYEDGSHSRGDLVRDTITVGSGSAKISLPDFLFGCGYDNTGHFPYRGAGIVGFGPGQDSFIFQARTLHGGKFSFCMAPPRSPPGRLSFGTAAEVSGPGFVSTPLILDYHHYEVMLQGVLVGTRRLRYFPNQHHFSSNDSEQVNTGKIVIDSGSLLTYLPNALHSQFQASVRQQIRLTPVQAPHPFTLCYLSQPFRNAGVPKITFQFPGANLELITLYNTFVQVSSVTLCLGILPTEDSAILGNLALTNFVTGYDIVRKRFSFKPTNCSKY